MIVAAFFLKVSAHLLLPAYAYIVPERFAHRLTDKSWDHKQFTRRKETFSKTVPRLAPS